MKFQKGHPGYKKVGTKHTKTLEMEQRREAGSVRTFIVENISV